MGNKSFDSEFRNECGRILDELYNKPMNIGETKIKRIVIEVEKRHIDYLVDLNLIKDLKTGSGGKYGIQLERKGYEVFEKYNGWTNYLNKVVDRDLKISKAKELAIEYWWLSIAISLLSLILAIISLCIKK